MLVAFFPQQPIRLAWEERGGGEGVAYVSPTLLKEPMGVVLGGVALVKIAKTEGGAGGVASVSPASFSYWSGVVFRGVASF